MDAQEDQHTRQEVTTVAPTGIAKVMISQMNKQTKEKSMKLNTSPKVGLQPSVQWRVSHLIINSLIGVLSDLSS